jgi:dolichyl-phosphate-mannose-protein mannosyltransferase
MEGSILDPRAPRPELSDSARWRYAKTLWIAGAALLAYSLTIALTGGIDFTLASVRLRSRSWQRPALLGFLCVAIVATVDRRRAWRVAGQVINGVWRAWTAIVTATPPAAIAIAAATWTVVAGLAFGTFVAGGADSSGYLNQARLFATGRALDDSRISDPPRWKETGYKLAPLGYRPAADPTKLAPTYPPGYPLLMAPAFRLNVRVAYLIVPLCGALAVWLTYALGRRLRMPGAGAAAALLLSLSPTFLYQLIQPMSDVPVTAAWLFAIYFARQATLSTAVLSGLAAGVATMIRPNLLPLAGLTWMACVISDTGRRWSRGGAAIAATIPGLVTLGAIQSIRYGSPFASGYGSFVSLFGWENLWPNLERYPRWMFETHTPLIALFLFAPLWFVRRREDRSFLLLLWGFALAVVAAYLPYVYFQTFEWTYTRFLLPAIPLMWLLGAALLNLGTTRTSPASRAAIVVPLVVLVGGFCVYVAKTRFIFDLRVGEQKYVQTADFVREVLPPNALLISMQHSGSLWFYTTRPIVRWDYVDPRELNDLLTWAADRAYQPFVVVDREEFERMEARFRSRAPQALERLQPLAEFGDATVYAVK